MEKEKEKSCDLMPTFHSSVAEDAIRFAEYSRKFREISLIAIEKYNREMKEKKRKSSPFPFVSEGMQNINVQKFESLHIDNSAKSREKLSSSPMSKDYAGGSAKSDMEEEEYPERVPYCFDQSDLIRLARTREYIDKVAKIMDKKFKAICESPEYLKLKETLGNTSAKIIITGTKREDKKPEDIHKGQKDKKLEDIQVTESEISRKCPSQCRFTILSLSFLPVFLFLLCFGLSHINHASDIVESENEILDHDKTVRVLTEYLQQDIPLFKVVALIGDTSVDKSCTMDIMKKRLHKKNGNNFSSSSNFVVLKNLRAEHSTDVINFVRMYQKAYGNRHFIILVVFNIEQINDESTHSIDMNLTINIVKDSFAEANIVGKIIPFKLLSEKILEKYIITAENIGQTFLQKQINYIKRRLIKDNINCKKADDC